MALAGAGALALSSCDSNFFQGPLSLRADGERIEVALCFSAEIDHVSGLERGEHTEREWVEFWSEEISASAHTGDIVTPSASGGAEVFVEPTMNPGNELDIALLAGGSIVESAVFRVPDDGLPDGAWLQPDGTLTAEACPTGREERIGDD